MIPEVHTDITVTHFTNAHGYHRAIIHIVRYSRHGLWSSDRTELLYKKK